MRSVLISLPFQDPSTPSLGLALLSAALFEQGISHVIEDANLDFLHYIEQGRWGAYGAWPPFHPAHVRSATEYLAGFRRQQSMLRRLSDTFPDYHFSPYQLAITTGWPDLAEVKRTALDPQGIWMRWLEQSDILRRITVATPTWIGLSVNFDGQLPAAMALGHTLKQQSGATVIWGGGVVNAFAHLLTAATPIWDCADGIVLGAGEAMVRCMRENDGQTIPEGAVRVAEGAWIAKQQTLEPCRRPRFEAFPLQLYRAAGIVLPYRVFGRCHWGRCAFCADRKYHFHEDRLAGDPRRIAEELVSLETRHGARGIYLLDAELPALFMAEMADALYHMGSTLRWGGNSRLSEQLSDPMVAKRLHRGGCRFLRFGLESGSDDILRKMVKGTTVERSERVVRAVSEAGIGVHVYLMQGFPGETPEDMERTKRFLRQQEKNLDSCNVSGFELYEGASLVSNLPDTAIVRNTKPGYWSYPKLASNIENRNLSSQIEEGFYANKAQTRCFPTLGDSLLFADRFTLSHKLVE